MNRIKELRKANNLSLRELEKKVRISRSLISLYELGKRNPNIKTWIKLANFFRVSVPYLQGADETQYSLSDNGKDLIIKILNDAYFDRLIYTSFDDLRVKVRSYIKEGNLNDKKLSSKKDNSRFWLDNFGFLFNRPNITSYVEKYIKLADYSIFMKLVDLITSKIENEYNSKYFNSNPIIKFQKKPTSLSIDKADKSLLAFLKNQSKIEKILKDNHIPEIILQNANALTDRLYMLGNVSQINDLCNEYKYQFDNLQTKLISELKKAGIPK